MRRFLLTAVSATALMLGGCIIIADGHHDDDRVRYTGGDIKSQLDPDVGSRHQTDGVVKITEPIGDSERCPQYAVITNDVTGLPNAPAEQSSDIQAASTFEIELTPRNGERCGPGWEG